MVLASLLDKAKSLAQKSPDKVRTVIDRVEETLDKTTGGKYTEKIHKVSDTVEQQLGLSAEPDTEEAAEDAPLDVAEETSADDTEAK
ncbi:antitoxin [Hoyosella sp. YIM 151337]|uniref:antitoxin n=1 Tax=Hoyosella sp. YIM 151337 TaxID=2992742 RepID=UPI002236A735|nr:antitoxin [Hoyosella sp. YIM 151337]MCW4354338.1 antitoxin [Hoyosella sp. YIM 151337]